MEMGRIDLIEHHFRIPSPEHEIFFEPFQVNGIRVFIKRDDLIHPFVSGNKWRKMQRYIKDAFDSGCDTLVTYGGAFSNHLLATAAAGSIFGLKTKGIIKGLHADLNNPVLTLCRIFGMTCEITSSDEYNDLKRDNSRNAGASYMIPEGGYGHIGALGCEQLIEELQQSYDHLFCSVGTGTTLAGICNGLIKKGFSTEINGISALKGADSLMNEIQELTPQGTFNLHRNYHHGGYAKVSPELVKFIGEFTAETGVLLDPVYTGKMFYALSDLIASGYIPEGSRILCVHTGGLTGLMNERMLKKFSR